MKSTRVIALLFIAASTLIGRPAPGAEPGLTPAEAALAQKLAGTYWSPPDTGPLGDGTHWIRFNADGTLALGSRPGLHPWKPIDDSTVQFQTKEPAKSWHQLRFNADLTAATEVSKNAPKEAPYGTIYHKLGAPGSAMPASAGGNTAAGSAVPEVDSKTSVLQVLSREAANVSDWALAPLDQAVPPEIRHNLRMLREDLLDEAKMNPVAGPEAYATGSQLCDALVAVLDERDQTLVRYGYRVAQANANTVVDSPSLDADRSAITTPRSRQNSWPQYARENRQAAEIFREQQNAADVKKELPKVEWSDRAAVLHKRLDILYEQYREAVRETTKPPQAKRA